MQGPVLISSDPGQHVRWLQDLVALGFDEVYLHHVGQEQTEWLEVFGEKVLPELDVTVKPPVAPAVTRVPA
jgi:alkanesulfonate monooxygenase SsuD/methylene tetrahydromethanopterin reductase-like flavin-dependent oxidoreductase (luciferase family)